MHERGQASVEVVAGLPALFLSALIALQLLAAGYALTLADGAAEAGALAVAAGEEPRRAARAALPGWAQRRIRVDLDGGRVAVRLEPPAVLPVLSQALEVSSMAWAREEAH